MQEDIRHLIEDILADALAILFASLAISNHVLVDKLAHDFLERAVFLHANSS